MREDASTPTAQPPTPSALDPVCGMTVNPATAKASFEHDGKTYYFCSQDCADSFRASPEDYL